MPGELSNQLSGNPGELPMPEPYLKLMWKDGAYKVSRAGVDWLDCYIADQMHAYADACTAELRERVLALEATLRMIQGACDYQQSVARAALKDAP
jgi:hypothetical protein